MYAYIKGKLAAKSNEYVIVDNGGIGYKIFTAFSTIESIGSEGDDVKLFTHHYVREDNINLFGFRSMEELSMFEMLLSVSGVGPKAAIAVLSTLSPSKFSLCVITDDAKSLTKAQGIGLKTAQRIILELRDKIKKEDITSITQSGSVDTPSDSSVTGEAISALMVLGYSPIEARNAVSAVYKEGTELEVLIKAALKSLVR
jgi:Holliday junction DNA helicase RuvA